MVSVQEAQATYLAALERYERERSDVAREAYRQAAQELRALVVEGRSGAVTQANVRE